MTLATAEADSAFRAHERFLWGLCYRLSGSAADADDLVQETFARALARPPADLTLPWRPWLVRVATNLGRDLLRRRRRTPYAGPWLPSPIDTGDSASPDDAAGPFASEPDTAAPAIRDAEQRYDLLESASFAFLLALEALSPLQRAVLLLRDVFDHSVREAASALSLTETNVKVLHHRARRAMAAYDRTRAAPTRARQEAARLALGRFLEALAAGDEAAIRALLADDVQAISDGGGEFHAARVPVLGAAKVARFLFRLGTRRGAGARVEPRTLNGLPALIVDMTDGVAGEAPRTILACDVAPDGRMTRVYSVLATRKLTALAPTA
jgi:RNA polymerase sigma-70 factor (ECF subfamily)